MGKSFDIPLYDSVLHPSIEEYVNSYGALGRFKGYDHFQKLAQAGFITPGTIVGLEHHRIVQGEHGSEKHASTIEYRVISKETTKIIAGKKHSPTHLALEKLAAREHEALQDPQYVLKRHLFSWSFYSPKPI